MRTSWFPGYNGRVRDIDEPPTAANATFRRRLDWLQAMRGLAAFAVVLTHVRFQFADTPMAEAAARWLTPGESGVDLFFVISGFIMAHTLRGDPGGWFSAKSFAIRRLARVWPAYFVLTIVAGLLYFHQNLFLDPTVFGNFIKSIFFVPVDYRTIDAKQILIQGWTLNYEIYFYFVLAACLVAGRFRWATFCAWFILTLIVLPILFKAPSLIDPRLAFPDERYPIHYLTVITNPIIWEFVGGAFAGLAFNTSLRFGWAPAGWTTMLVAVVVCFVGVFDPAYSHGPAQWGWRYVLLVLTFSIVSKDVDLKIHPAFVGLGNISYTLYLTHGITISCLSQIFKGSWIEDRDHALIYAVVTIASCVFAARICSRFLEKTLSDNFRTVVERLLRLAPSSLRGAAIVDPLGGCPIGGVDPPHTLSPIVAERRTAEAG
jgi:exopolysaccharide production protein ExoZ